MWNQWRKRNPGLQPDLSGADFRWVNLRAVELSRAELIKANLREASLSGANLSGANLSGADLRLASVGYIIFGDVDLSEVKGLHRVHHNGPSTIGTDTLVRSQGKIPEVFLRGAGLPDIFIEFLPSLTNQPIQFYSCFISYSGKDEAFAKRLHADLQSEGVRCWFAPEDLKIGARIRVGIDQSIRLHDKLLLVLSRHSIASDWVEQEVETAMEKERQQGETVLFPIRLDDVVMDEGIGWTAHIKRTRHIGDFTRWKNHDAYRKAFQRLLRDLQVEKAET